MRQKQIVKLLRTMCTTFLVCSGAKYRLFAPVLDKQFARWYYMHMGTVTDDIKKTIRDSGLSIRNLSNLSGVPRIPLNRFMNGQTELRLSMVDVLADFFGLSLMPVDKKKKRGSK